jgi:RNA polymerase sigma-70 factor (ECF subfamily)
MSWAGQVTLSEAISIPESAADDLDAMVREHARFVFRVAFSVLRNREDAEDAAQETFMRLMKQDLRKIEQPRAWLARVAWRCALDRTQRVREQSLDDEDFHQQLPSSAAGADEVLLEQQMKALLERMIEHLPRELRDVVRLSTVDEMTSAEAAQVLGIPDASVRTRLFRARQLLKEKMIKVLEGRNEI